MELRLCKFAWENPWPQEEMVAVELTSAGANAAPFLVALTADEAPIDPAQKRISASLTELIQRGAPTFAELQPSGAAYSGEWTSVRLNSIPVEIGGRYYDGFRFTVPPDGPADLVWGFQASAADFDSWFIQPTTGIIKVGFEDWYHVGARHSADPGEELVVQFLSGRKLDPGREYFIWFGADAAEAVEMQVKLTFTAVGLVESNRPETLLGALSTGLDEGVTTHRCLGAVRQLNGWRWRAGPEYTGLKCLAGSGRAGWPWRS